MMVGSGADLPVLFLSCFLGGLATVVSSDCFWADLLGIAIAAFKIYRDNYQTPASVLVTSEVGGRVEPIVK